MYVSFFSVHCSTKEADPHKGGHYIFAVKCSDLPCGGQARFGFHDGDLNIFCQNPGCFFFLRPSWGSGSVSSGPVGPSLSISGSPGTLGTPGTESGEVDGS